MPSMNSTNDVVPDARLSSPVKLSPSKLSMNHGAFMANIQNGHSPNRDGSPGISSSSKVIEALHSQIDNLTRTNLELTVQSNNLLSRLESANSTHSKQLESISSLKHENDNLNLMLSRKERRVRELEEQTAKLKNSYEEAAVDNKSLHSQLQKLTQREGTREEQFLQVQVQYDALLDAQGRYREQHSREVEELRAQLEAFKTDQEAHASRALKALANNQSALQSTLDGYADKYQNLAFVEKEHHELLDRECDSLRSQLALPKWEELYLESRQMVFEYADKTDFKLSASFLDQHGRNRTNSDAKLPQTCQESHQATSSNASSPNLSSSSGFINSQQIRVPKVRNSSSAKRSSFYGTNVPITASPVPGARQPSSSSVIASSGTLPGVRRSSSMRGSTPPSRNSSGERPGPETSSSGSKGHSKPFPSYKKKRNPSQVLNKPNEIASKSQ
ncbi:LAME_0E06304g1_1 [Lachancea meyersii CBS 8951]|uniref:SWI5-dependent HO expression protein 3 n=1 Tax=Lachancea meyersii CBS 8951 TaxID=1266667 RepID=A0A1G4JHR1_9SACH|nr:LAME_0E06304g1_1 [Lachancea meyersii CBS 8951]